MKAAVLIGTALLAVTTLHAQQFTPSKTQQKQLEHVQAHAKAVREKARRESLELQKAMISLSAEGELVKAENNWPADVGLNFDSLLFSEPQKPVPAIPIQAPNPPAQPKLQEEPKK